MNTTSALSASSLAALRRDAAAAPQDEATLRQFPTLWTHEKTQHGAEDFPALTAEERHVYTALRQNIWGQAVRLEQERISWDIAWPALQRAARNPRRAD